LREADRVVKSVAPVSLMASASLRVRVRDANDITRCISKDSIAIRMIRPEICLPFAANEKGLQRQDLSDRRTPHRSSSEEDTGSGRGGLGVPVLAGGRLSRRTTLVHASLATRRSLRPSRCQIRDFAHSWTACRVPAYLMLRDVSALQCVHTVD